MPVKTPTSAPFWDALARAPDCDPVLAVGAAYVFYPRTLAPGTLADDLEWREIDGTGTLYTYTVARRPVGPHFAEAAAAAGGRRMGRGAAVQDRNGQRRTRTSRVGMRVQPVFCDYPDHDVTMLRYEPE